MKERAAITDIAGVRGVNQYLLVDPDGTILAHEAKQPDHLARMAVSCAGPLSAMGKNHFRYLCFQRENQANIFIFPVGNGYLGVIKQEGVDDEAMVGDVTKFLNVRFGQGK